MTDALPLASLLGLVRRLDRAQVAEAARPQHGGPMTTRNSRNAPLDSGQMPLDGAQRKYVRYVPDFSIGTIVQIIVVLGSAVTIYTGIREDQVRQRGELDAVKASTIVDRTQTKEALADLKQDVKDLQKSTNEIKESLAILRGRAADTTRK